MTDPTSEARYSRHPDMLSSDIDDETVVLSLDSGFFYSIGGIGPFLWSLLETPRTAQDLVDEVCKEFEVDAQTADQDVRKFLKDLAGNGIVSQA